MQYISHLIKALTLSEAACLATDKTTEKYTEYDILYLGCVQPKKGRSLSVYCLSHDFVMTTAYEEDPRFLSKKEKKQLLSPEEKAHVHRSFSRGEFFQLHPKFIERLANSGSMKITDFPFHTITIALSNKKLRDWQCESKPGQKKRWAKTFNSSITQNDDITSIQFSDIRIDRMELENFLDTQYEQSIANIHASTVQAVAKLKPTSNWILRVQVEATARFIRLRANGANPTVNNILDDLVRWCVAHGVRTTNGLNPSGETIRRHALRKWVRPA